MTLRDAMENEVRPIRLLLDGTPLTIPPEAQAHIIARLLAVRPDKEATGNLEKLGARFLGNPLFAGIVKGILGGLVVNVARMAQPYAPGFPLPTPEVVAAMTDPLGFLVAYLQSAALYALATRVWNVSIAPAPDGVGGIITDVAPAESAPPAARALGTAAATAASAPRSATDGATVGADVAS